MSQVMWECEHMRFLERTDLLPGRRTKVWEVTARRDGACLGLVHWLGRWRQYVFSPAKDCVFSVGCMRDIIKFIEEHKDERR